MKKQTRNIIFGLAAAIAVAGIAIIWSVNTPAPMAQTKVVFHLDSDFGSSLVRVAAAEGIFTKHGVDARLIDFPDGVGALDALLQSPASEVALATSSGFAFASNLPVNNSLKIISQLANNEDNYYWVVKKGKGNGTVEGLKGLKLGYPNVSGYRAFEEFSLKDHGLSATDVTLVPMGSSDFASAMAAGTIDAHPSRILLTQKTMAAVKNQAYEMHDVGAYDWFNVLSATPNTIAKHPAVMKAVLGALIDAQTFSFANPDLARADVAKSLKITAAEVPKNLTDSLNVRLSNGLLRQLTKNRNLRAQDAKLPVSAYFNKAQDVLDAKLLLELAPMVVHLG